MTYGLKLSPCRIEPQPLSKALCCHRLWCSFALRLHLLRMFCGFLVATYRCHQACGLGPNLILLRPGADSGLALDLGSRFRDYILKFISGGNFRTRA